MRILFIYTSQHILSGENAEKLEKGNGKRACVNFYCFVARVFVCEWISIWIQISIWIWIWMKINAERWAWCGRPKIDGTKYPARKSLSGPPFSAPETYLFILIISILPLALVPRRISMQTTFMTFDTERLIASRLRCSLERGVFQEKPEDFLVKVYLCFQDVYFVVKLRSVIAYYLMNNIFRTNNILNSWNKRKAYY